MVTTWPWFIKGTRRISLWRRSQVPERKASCLCLVSYEIKTRETLPVLLVLDKIEGKFSWGSISGDSGKDRETDDGLRWRDGAPVSTGYTCDLGGSGPVLSAELWSTSDWHWASIHWPYSVPRMPTVFCLNHRTCLLFISLTVQGMQKSIVDLSLRETYKNPPKGISLSCQKFPLRESML